MLRLDVYMLLTLQDALLDPSSTTCAVALLNLSEIDVLIGAVKETVHLTLAQAREILTDMKNGLVTYCDMISGALDLRERNETSARTLFQDCLKSAWGKDTQGVIYCLERLADVSKWSIEFHGQEKWPVLYLCSAHISREKLAFYKALLFIGDLFMEVDQVTAQNLFIVALEGFTSMDVHRSRAQCMLWLGDLAQRKGETTEAAELWKSARSLFERSLQAKDVAAIDLRLVALEQGHKKSLAKLTTLHSPTIALVKDEDNSNIQVVSRKADETTTVML
ncbi:hypothetical protein C8F04DRAFT_48123 [Mycena alexandri]|uniref:Uncharacterized protein n=1 Tax=Mycena alexandri TaxID=1745969 RepID=A0AAD6WY21_9AGAR|nr:hypothetical protein C8F04DRAFT_48123 [Mycena alexandri]